MQELIVDKIIVPAKEGQYGWSCGVLAEEKFIWVNGEKAKGLEEGDTIKGVLKEKPYFKDGEQKMSYTLLDEHSKSAQEETSRKIVENTLNDLIGRVKKLEDVVFPE